LVNDRIDDKTPIVVSVPSAVGQHNFIVGNSLFDFLCLGFFRGYFALEQLAHNLDKTLRVFSSGRWKPKTDGDWWVGYGVNEEQRPILELLRKRLRLKAWRNSSRKFSRLQQLHLGHLQLRADRFTAEIVAGEIESWGRWISAN
jgi:hypothetical protein